MNQFSSGVLFYPILSLHVLFLSFSFNCAVSVLEGSFRYKLLIIYVHLDPWWPAKHILFHLLSLLSW